MEKNKTTSLIFIGAALASFVGAVATHDNNKSLSTGFLIGGFACQIISLKISFKATSKFQQALWFYNRDVLLK